MKSGDSIYMGKYKSIYSDQYEDDTPEDSIIVVFYGSIFAFILLVACIFGVGILLTICNLIDVLFSNLGI